MKKARGFTSFEFYFVMSVIGIIVLIALQRYVQLAEETKHLRFEGVAKNFNAAVYNHHASWIMAQQQTSTFQLNVDGLYMQFSGEGWPISIAAGKSLSAVVSLTSCLSLWNNLLQNAPSISYEGSHPYGSRSYHLTLPQAGVCRYELVTKQPKEFYFDYIPFSGQVLLHSLPITKNN